MADVKWVKLTTDMFNNRKIKHLRRLPEGNSIVLIWVMLLTMAGRCNSGGMVFLTENIPYTPKMLADELDFEESTVVLALNALESLNMIVTDSGYLTIPGWEEYQNIEGLDKIREQTRCRVANHRAKQKLLSGNVTSNVTVTQCNATDIDEEAEAMQGMSNTGYSESAQVAMYNAYQNRVATARQTYAQAVQNYDNAMTQARLSNNSALAEIAFNSLQQQLEYALQGFQYKNQLLLDQADKKLEVENLYYNRWQDVLTQMNQENSLAEQIRQYNESMSLEKMQFLQNLRTFDYENGLGIYAGEGSGGSGGGSGTISYNSYLANLSNRDRKALDQQAQLTEEEEETKKIGTISAPAFLGAPKYVN